jgi:nitroreductase
MRQAILEKSSDHYEKSPMYSNAFYRIKNFGMFFNAKTVISVCVNLSTSNYLNKGFNLDEIDKLLDSIEVISVGACIENMMLKINDLGLGACWCRVGYLYRKSLEKILGIEPPLFLVANIALGYPSEKEKAKPTTPRKDIGLAYRIIH